MSNEKKEVKKNEEEKKGTELNMEDLKDVSGGSIRNVEYTETKPISTGTQKDI